MKFDIIVGNPPYQKPSPNQTKLRKQIWPLFVTVSLDNLIDNGYLCIVHPTWWRLRKSKPNKLQLLLFSYDMVYVELAIKPFDAAVVVDYYVLRKSMTPEYLTNVGNTKVNIKTQHHHYSIGHLKFGSIAQSIINKYLSADYDNNFYPECNWQAASFNSIRTAQHKYIYYSGSHKREFADVKHQHHNKQKILVCTIRKLRPTYYDTPCGYGAGLSAFLTDEPTHLLDFLNSDTCKFLQVCFSVELQWFGKDAGFRNDNNWMKCLDVDNLHKIKLTPEEQALIKTVIHNTPV